MRRDGRARGWLSDQWFALQLRTWKRLFIWGYVLLGLAAVPLLFGDHATRGLLLAWYLPLAAGYLALLIWGGVQITRSIRLGRADLRTTRDATREDRASDEPGRVGPDLT